jgi:cardiolipin synthase
MRLALATALVVGASIVGASPASAAAPPPKLRVIVEPAATMAFLDKAISGAKHTIFVEMYELADTTIQDELIARSRDHVRVKVLLDKDYDAGSVNAPAYSALRAAHVPVRWADPHVIFHEKAVVIDGTTAYVGTGNLTAEYYATTRDFWVIDTQRADVDAITTAFDGDWGGGSPASAPSGVDLIWSPGAEATVLSLIDHAKHSISLESEELDADSVVDALVAAAKRHVVVHVTMTYSSSWRWAFDDLVDAGASVHLDYGESPVYIHAKALCVDCTTGAHGHGTILVGSQNLSVSSLVYNRELSILTTSRSVVEPILAVLDHDFAQASPYSP